MCSEESLVVVFVLQYSYIPMVALCVAHNAVMEVLKSIDDINKVLELSKEEPVFIYKHSVTCPYNAMAQKQVVALKHDYPIYAVVVQHARNVSNEIAKRLEVIHQTPQIILLQDAEVKAELSHGAITADAMLALLDNLSENSVAAEGVA